MGIQLAKRLDKLEQMIAINQGGGDSSPIGVYGLDRKLCGVFAMNADHYEAVDMEPELSIPKKLESILAPKRYKILYGGRGSAKTRTVVSLLIEKSRVKFERILCCREIQKSIQDSSYQELVDEISRRNLDDEFIILDKKITCIATGSTFSFEGLYRNQTKIKGYAGATIVWVEEGENISQKSWDFLVPTIRAEGSEIWVTFNPANDDDPTWTEHVASHLDDMVDGIYIGDNSIVIEMNFSDNPWFPKELEMERLKMMERDYDRYLWIWEGKFFDRSEAQVLAGKFTVKSFTEPEGFGEFYHGMDFGFSNDPSAVVRCYIYEECLYITHEAGGVGVPLDDHGKLIDSIPNAKNYKIRCDCARPETVNHMSRMGYNAVSAPKWPGSVEDGVEHLRSYKHIYIHPRCYETAKEAKLWSYKTDSRTDDVLPKLEDKHNHYWDAIRYALSPLIQQKDAGQIFAPSRFRRGRMR